MSSSLSSSLTSTRAFLSAFQITSGSPPRERKTEHRPLEKSDDNINDVCDTQTTTTRTTMTTKTRKKY